MEVLPLVTLKPAPETAACDRFTVAVPVLVTLTLCAAELPTAMLPKLTLVELAVRTPAPVATPGCVLAALVEPVQFERPITIRAMASNPRRLSGIAWRWSRVSPCVAGANVAFLRLYECVVMAPTV